MVSHSMFSNIMQGAISTITLFPFKLTAANIEKRLYSFFGKAMKRDDSHLDINFLSCGFMLTSGAIIEECIFRGFLMPNTEKILIDVGIEPDSAKTSAEILTALLFSYMHQPGSRLSTFIAGIEYASLANSFGLTSSIAAHIFHNNIINIMLSSLKSLKEKPKQLTLENSSDSENEPDKPNPSSSSEVNKDRWFFKMAVQQNNTTINNYAPSEGKGCRIR